MEERYAAVKGPHTEVSEGHHGPAKASSASSPSDPTLSASTSARVEPSSGTLDSFGFDTAGAPARGGREFGKRFERTGAFLRGALSGFSKPSALITPQSLPEAVAVHDAPNACPKPFFPLSTSSRIDTRIAEAKAAALSTHITWVQSGGVAQSATTPTASPPGYVHGEENGQPGFRNVFGSFGLRRQHERHAKVHFIDSLLRLSNAAVDSEAPATASVDADEDHGYRLGTSSERLTFYVGESALGVTAERSSDPCSAVRAKRHTAAVVIQRVVRTWSRYRDKKNKSKVIVEDPLVGGGNVLPKGLPPQHRSPCTSTTVSPSFPFMGFGRTSSYMDATSSVQVSKLGQAACHAQSSMPDSDQQHASSCSRRHSKGSHSSGQPPRHASRALTSAPGPHPSSELGPALSDFPPMSACGSNVSNRLWAGEHLHEQAVDDRPQWADRQAYIPSNRQAQQLLQSVETDEFWGTLYCVASNLITNLPYVQPLWQQLACWSEPVLYWLTLRKQRLSTCVDYRVSALLLIRVCVYIIVTGGLVFKLLTGVAWSEAMFTCYTIIFNVPGASVTNEPNAIRSVVANIYFLAGILVFAVFLGMIGEWFAHQIREMRVRAGGLLLEEHILILNASCDFIPVLCQLVTACVRNPAHLLHGRAIVVLADLPKEELEAKVNLALQAMSMKHSQVEIHARTGSPYLVSDLKRVSASEAAYVLALHPQASNAKSVASLNQASALMGAIASALNVVFNGDGDGKSVVVQMFGESKDVQQLDVMQDLLQDSPKMSFTVASISEDRFVGRLVAQTALQPGVLNVLEEACRKESNCGIRWILVTEEMGRGTYHDMRRRFLDVALMGYWSSRGVIRSDLRSGGVEEWPVHINPLQNDVIFPGDKLLVMAPCNMALSEGHNHSIYFDNGRSIELDVSSTPEPTFFATTSRKAIHRVSLMSRNTELPSKRLLVVGWPSDGIKSLQDAFDGFAVAGTHITFVMDQIPENPPKKPEGITVTYVQSRVTMSVENFMLGGIENADTVLIGMPEGLDYPESDALVLSSLLQIQRIARNLAHTVHVVGICKSSNTRKVAMDFLHSLENVNITFELVIANRLMSAMLMQTMIDPLFLYVFAEIMVLGAGNELYHLELGMLGFRPGELVRFAEVVEVGTLLHMSVLGYSQQNGLLPVLCPPQDCYIELAQGDKFIVLADLV